MTIDWPLLALIIVLTLAVVFTVAFVGFGAAYWGFRAGYQEARRDE